MKKGWELFYILHYLFRLTKNKLEREAYCDEAVWCNTFTGNSTLAIRLDYRSQNINEEVNTKIQNATEEMSKGECMVMGDFR